MLPKARQTGLTIRELPNETLVYDLQRHKAHCLNRTSAFVWKHCDGRTSVSDLAGRLNRELGIPADEEVVKLALEQLSRRRLLEKPLSSLSEDARHFRRTMLKRLALTAAALPIIMSMAVPKASAQQSKLV